jgi:hypothetical protein
MPRCGPDHEFNCRYCGCTLSQALHQQNFYIEVRPMITVEDLENWFTYHAPKEGQPEKYTAIRNAAFNLAEVILENTPACADQSAAIRLIREGVMTANAAIACET